MRPRCRIPDCPRVWFCRQEPFRRILDHTTANCFGFCVLFATVLIDFSDGRSRNDIVELIPQDDFPAVVQLLLWISRPVRCCPGREARQPFCLTVQQFELTVHPLVVRLTRVCAAMVLEVEFTIPRMDIAVSSRDVFMQLAKEVRGPCSALSVAGQASR